MHQKELAQQSCLQYQKECQGSTLALTVRKQKYISALLQKGGTQYRTILYCRKVVHNIELYYIYCRKVVHNIELYYTAERWYTISNYIIYTAERWYTVETRSPITHAVRMLIRITRMIRTSSEPTFRVSRAASTWKFNTMTLKE